MIVAVIDNGSLEPAAHTALRALAGALSAEAGVPVHAVSWKHSHRIAPEALVPPAGETAPRRAWTLEPFVRTHHEAGARDFLFVPFFVSAQGAIGSALRSDLEALAAELPGLRFAFTAGLAAREALLPILVARIREAMTTGTAAPAVAVVDHGGPSLLSATLRDRLAAQAAAALGSEVAALAPASMEGAHGPLLEEQLRAPGFAGRDVIVAPLFLAPGRHAGPQGDIAQICAASPARCRIAGLIGSHPLAAEALAGALRDTLASFHAHTSA